MFYGVLSGLVPVFQKHVINIKDKEWNILCLQNPDLCIDMALNSISPDA